MSPLIINLKSWKSFRELAGYSLEILSDRVVFRCGANSFSGASHLLFFIIYEDPLTFSVFGHPQFVETNNKTQPVPVVIFVLFKQSCPIFL